MLTINHAETALQGGVTELSEGRSGASALASTLGAVSVMVTSRIEDVEDAWRGCAPRKAR